MSIDIRGVRVRLGGREVLSGVDLHAPTGAVTGLVGPNGSGKSTLLRTVYRAHTPTAGQVLLDGRDVRRMRPRALARRLAVVTQESEVPFDQTAWDLAALGRLPHRGPWRAETGEDRDIVAAALGQVGAAHLAGRVFHTLSGGEKQRVLIARALAQRADHLILDEPTNHLDIRHQLDVVALVASLGATVLLTLHDLNLAAAHCDHLHVLDRGTVRGSGPPGRTLTPGAVRGCFQVEADIVAHPRTHRPQLLFSRPDHDKEHTDDTHVL